MTTLVIRPFRDEDREAITEFRNARLPVHLQETVAEWRRADSRKPEGEVALRLCAVASDDQPVAYLNAVDRGTTAWRKPGVCGFGVWVAAAYQRQGIGGQLYERAVEFARQHELVRLSAFVRFCQPGEPAIRFLEKRGFTEVDREIPVMLDLKTFPREQFVSPVPDGIRFLSYAEAGDTLENRQTLHALMAKIDRDIPTNDVQPESPAFEQWVKDLDTPEWNSDALILASDSASKWVGISQLGFQEHTNIAWTFLTGVLPEYRGLGIAYALKLRAIDAAIARGCPLILTENHEDNAPMRAINKKLGFVLEAPDVSYSKDLEPLPLVPRSLPC
ncbi:MAG: GNAT family N-acetyltransferase [Janthinobacterium lividum]